MKSDKSFRADGGDIGTGRLREIADNPYGDEEKCWLAKKVLALQVKLDSVRRTLKVNNEAACSLVDENDELKRNLEAADKRIAELEALEAKTVWSDIDMSDADCFTITRLHEIIYASELKWPEPKLLARFMLDVKQHAGIAKGE